MREIDYGKLYTYRELEEVILDLGKEYPDMMRVSTLATTEEGRNIYLVEITDNVNSPETEKKPGYYAQASIHASEASGGTVSLHLMETLLKEKPEILKEVVFYIVPRVNPDGVEDNLLHNAPNRSRRYLDERAKGNLFYAKDIDGDGLIMQMRVKNPLGAYREDAPGVMVLRQPGEIEGEFYDVYTEGEFENYDGLPARPAYRSYDYNRCFPMKWKSRRDSTAYPGKSIENRAILEFLTTHLNIFAGLDFHNGQNAVLRPPMCEDSQIDRGDLTTIIEVGELASKIMGFPLIHEYKYAKYPRVLPGNSNDFAYSVMGISHYVIELGNGFNDIGLSTPEYLACTKRDSYYKNIREYSEKEGYEVFRDFKPFNHPQLGEVEIGGRIDGRAYFQNPKVLANIAPKTTEFMLKHAAMRPYLKVDSCECVNVGGDIYRIRAQVKNLGIFGTKVMKSAEGYESEYPVYMFLQSDKEFEVLSRPGVYDLQKLAPLGGAQTEWFVRKDKDTVIEVCAEHPKAVNSKVLVK